MLITLGFWEGGCPLRCDIAPPLFRAKRPGDEVGAQLTSTTSESFSLFIYLNATPCTLLSVFTLIKTIPLKT